ncbi:hypothetical protein RD792_006774 [Penstemon davidsonii]|uniref:Uncharacterized protein n=1 Tax=Penstemon davidsonii TaxID=160366 RepID=A0ABR0DBR4_9LAMI|nr:hypothetical protein RD792_006774 [Penstemon davidsonii]
MPWESRLSHTLRSKNCCADALAAKAGVDTLWRQDTWITICESNKKTGGYHHRTGGERHNTWGAPLEPNPSDLKEDRRKTTTLPVVRLRYVEQELAKKRGKNIDEENQVENEVKRAEDELYKIPEHLKVKRRSSEESSTQWTTGIAEIQLPIEYKLRNIEETEAAKKLLQEKRLAGRAKTDSGIPSSFSADFSQRGKDYAEKLRKDQPEVKHKDKGGGDGKGVESRHHQDSVSDGAVRRQAATDEIMLDRFRKRERQRVVRR